MKKYSIVFLLCFLMLCLFAVVDSYSFYDGKLHVIVCDVGQGDGIIVKTPQNNILVYDAGPDESILACLSDYMPFWHRSIDLLVLSHPHNDHFMGMFSVLTAFTVKSYISEAIMNSSISFTELQKELQRRGVRQHILGRGGAIEFPGRVVVKVLGPSEEFRMQTSPDGFIASSGEFASLILRITYEDFSILLTGDSQVAGLTDASPQEATVIQVPHHGSRSGLSSEIVENISPDLAFISVGENRYGHPTQEILSLLKEHNIRTLRTDTHGRLTLKSDGKTYSVTTEHSP